MFIYTSCGLVTQTLEGGNSIGNGDVGLRVVILLSSVEGVGQLGVATEAVLNHVTQRHLGAVGEEAVHIHGNTAGIAGGAIGSGGNLKTEQIVKLGFPTIVVVTHVLAHLCPAVETVRMVDHAALADHVSLPGSIHLGIVVGSAADGRTDDVSAIVLSPLDEGSIAGGGVIGDVGSIGGFADPQQVAHGDASLEDVVGTAQSIEREGLQDNATAGVAHVHLAVLVEGLIAGIVGDDVPTLLGQHVIHALLHVAGVQPALLELDVDAGTVAGVLGIGLVTSCEVVLDEVHILGVVLALGLDGVVDLLQGHALVLVLDFVGEHAAALSVTHEALALCIGDLVLDGADVQRMMSMMLMTLMYFWELLITVSPFL